MRITAAQLRQIIKEELLREAVDPKIKSLVKQLQAKIGMLPKEQDGVWGPLTDNRWGNFIIHKLGTGPNARVVKDSSGNIIDPIMIAPDWITIAPQLSGGLIGTSSPGGARIPPLTGDTQGALDFTDFIINLPAVNAVFPSKQWWYGGSSEPQDLKHYPGFNYKSWPIWSYVDHDADPQNREVFDVSPDDLRSMQGAFLGFLMAGKKVLIGGSRAAILRGAKFYKITDDATLRSFFKIT